MGPTRIFHIEDSIADATLFEMAAAECQPAPQIEHFIDGYSALEHLSDSTKSLPDVVLLDLSMPGLSGLDVLTAIRTHPRLRRLFVAILTTSDDPRDIALSYERNVNVYITKPHIPGGFRSTAKVIHELCTKIELPPAGEYEYRPVIDPG